MHHGISIMIPTQNSKADSSPSSEYQLTSPQLLQTINLAADSKHLPTTPAPPHVLPSALPILILLTCLPSFLLAAHYIRKDYHAFLALGPGGTPSTPTGYARITVLRLLTIPDPLAPPSLPPTLHPKHGFLPHTLAPRHGPRPHVAGIAPHRQTDQKASAANYAALTRAIHGLAAQHPHTLSTGTSCFEKHSTGIFCAAAVAATKSPAIASRVLSPAQARRLTCHGEVCHSHSSDGSLHLALHPADVRAVLEKG
ncbi:uncharacterized protein ACLA_023900 [Aspergillus clavatus NRRL 1]|uniref:Luciferase domain-containing protein n=1 Tax=Aspergillus clavatus (strain ATCC 1007 / CBS 513.65 / DSM 816 / NCTC 3887 / NRRL 1 / QM 1276 / 107) TaxID=344612 RepID=A1CPV4_ASPCL|nr:uncharacterized protein ACLA_023900 [Aspergillus clavatus NRRL 1]EAW07675.1 conserved hypothetical protein [Aspergillus clavatus NRRL 1]